MDAKQVELWIVFNRALLDSGRIEAQVYPTKSKAEEAKTVDTIGEPLQVMLTVPASSRPSKYDYAQE